MNDFAPAVRLTGMRAALSFLAAFLSASILPARAADGEFPDREFAPRSRALDAEEGEAYLWSIGGTFIPLAAAVGIGRYTDAGDDLALPLVFLGAGAVTLGPSMGQFKAGAIGHGVAATALRGAGEAIAFVAVMRSLCIMCDAEVAESKPSPVGGVIVGSVLYLTGTVYSLANIHQAYAAKREAAAFSALRIAPTLALERENRFRPGLQATLRF